LIKTADLLVCNDSGPLHLAAAFETPSVALFGPTVASKWQPPGPQHKMIQKSGFCEGCVGWHPAARCLHDGACMKSITMDEVSAVVAHLLSRKRELL
jgi:ADP-heptose:LPS heptosyltransferase